MGDCVEFILSDGVKILFVLENLVFEWVKNEFVCVGSEMWWDIIVMVIEYEGDNFILL